MKLSLIIAIFLFAVSLSGQAATLSLESCATIKNPVERLACYDRLADRLHADTAKESDAASTSTVDLPAPKADVIEPAAPAVTQAVTEVDSTPDTETVFGLEHKQKPEKERPDELKLKWTRKKKDAYGKWIITLKNGQVWRQTDSKRFSFGNAEQWVVISRGFAGGFFLKEPERKKQIRVKRVK